MQAAVIDADGHVLDRDANIRSFMEEPFCKRKGSLLPSDGWDASGNGQMGIHTHDVPIRIRDMDLEGIEVSVLFPTGGFSVTRLPEKEYAAAFCRAYNNWVASVCQESDRLRGVALVPFQNVPAAVAEVDRAVTKLGLVGVTVASAGLKEHLGEATFWPIYEELQRVNAPLLIHNSRQGPPGEVRCDTFLFMHTIGRPFSTLQDCAALMYGGVPERFPRLRVAFLECGIGWVPYWMDRMDEEYEHRPSEAPLLKAKPSEYMRGGQWFYAVEPEESSLPYALERIGEDQVLFASDYPHWDGMFPHVVSTIRGRQDVTERAKGKLLGANAKKLYGWAD